MASCENKYTTLLDLSRQAKVITGETACFDGKIEVGIPFSGYPTGVDTGTTVSLGVVSSETAVFSGNTGTTVFDVSNTGSTNYNALFSGYSGTVWTNSLFSGNTSGLTSPITPLSADTQIMGPFWTLTQTGMTGDYVIGTQYTGYSITYSFSQVSQMGIITGYTAYSGFSSASQENFSAGTLDYKGPLDYISSVEDATIDGRLTTKKLTVTDGASSATTGYVLTQLDSTGKAGWAFNSASASTNTFVTGGTLTGTNLDLTWNTGGSVPSIDLSTLSGGTSFWLESGTTNGVLVDKKGGSSYNVLGTSPGTIIAAGSGHTINDSKYSSFLGGLNNIISGTTSSLFGSNIHIGGVGNSINGSTTLHYDNLILGGTVNSNFSSRSSVMIGTTDSFMSGTVNSFIFGGGNHKGGSTGFGLTENESSGIIGGTNNTFAQGIDRSVIIGGNGLSATTSDTVYVPNLTVRNDYILHSDSVSSVSDLPGTLVGLMKGKITYFNWSGATSHIISNDDTLGRSGINMGNFSNYPATETYGFLHYFNSGHTRTGTHPVGTGFYRDKLVLKGASDVSGMVIHPQAGNSSGSLWFEMDGSSVMKLKGDGAGKARLGIAMSVDGTEDATANLQIGGTGTTGTFKYVDGNEQSGYVLTSDADGVGTWQASSGGGGVTIDPYNNSGSGTTISWDVSGTSTNYEATFTGNTTLNLINVRNGDYGTIIVTQDGVGSHTLTFNNINGGAGTHYVVNGGGGTPILTSNPNAIDILSFTYNGSAMYWTVGNDYT